MTTFFPNVVFIDSGIGGLSYLTSYQQVDTSANLTYFADSGYFPYGEKGEEQVRRRVEKVVQFISRRIVPDIVVLACNTASVVALEHVRTIFSFPFVGVVPAVKPAAELANEGRIVVLATRATAQDPYTEELVEKFAQSSTVDRIGLPGLVTLVEREICSSGRESAVSLYLAEEVIPKIPPDTSVVVLACTHFVHVRQQLRSLLPKSVAVVDSVDGVVRRIAAIRRQLADGSGKRTVRQPRPLFLTTNDLRYEYQCFRGTFSTEAVKI